MWQVKKFKSAATQAAWIAKNEHRYQMVVLFVNNGFAVEYRKLRRIG